MQIEIKEIEQCRLSVHYEADALEVLNKRAEVLNLFKKAPVPGFRQGKAPPDVINVHYRQQVDESLKRALAEDAFHNTIFEKKLRVHGAPVFHSASYNGGTFSCEFEVRTKPEFELSNIKGLEIPKPADPISVADLSEKIMQDLRVKGGDTLPFTEDDFVQEGDSVLINCEAFIDGEKNDNLSNEGEILKIGDHAVKEFDQNLYGMKNGDVREFDIKIPETGLPSVAGKTVHFVVTLQLGSKLIPAALDDELAKKAGKENFEELKKFIGEIAFARVANNARALINEAICHRLVDENKVDIPSWMYLSEAQYLAYQSQLNWDTMIDIDKEKFIDLAKKNVTLSLVLDKVREEEPETQLTDQEVFEMIKQRLMQTETAESVNEKIKQMNATGQMQILFSRIRDEFTLDFIVKNSRIIE